MASNSVASVSIDVLANIANMVADLGKAQNEHAKAAREFQKSWQEAVASVEESFKSLAELAGVGLSLDWIKELVSGTMEAAEHVTSLSQSLGMSTQTLQTVGYAAGLVGVNFDTAATGAAHLERSAEQAAAGNVQMAEAFRALGISAGQVSDLLKNPDQLLQTVAAHISDFADGAGKTAVVMQLFGRNAQEMIPLLDKLGPQFASLREEAERLGLVLSDQDQKALIEASDKFSEIGQQAKGLENQLVIGLLPALNTLSTTLSGVLTSGAFKEMVHGIAIDIDEIVIAAGQAIEKLKGWKNALSDALGYDKNKLGWNDVAGDLVTIADLFTKFKVNVENNWEVMKAAWALFTNDLKTQWTTFLSEAENGLSKFLAVLSNAELLKGNIAGAKALAGWSDELAKASAAAKTGEVDLTKYTDAIDANTAAGVADIQAHHQWAQEVRATASAEGEHTNAVNDAKKALADYDAQKQQHAALEKQYENDLQKLNELMAQIATGLSGPYLAAQKAYDDGEALLNKTYAEGIALGKDKHELALQMQADEDLLEKRLAATIERIKEQHDQFAKLDEQIQLQQTLLATEPSQRAAATAALAAYNEALKNNVDLYGEAIPANRDIHDVLQEQLPLWIATKQRLDDLTAALRDQEEVLKSWAGIATNAFDTFATDVAKDMVEGGSLMKDLDNIWKQVVESMIANAMKLAVINPIINSVFGLSGTSGQLPMQSFGNMFQNIQSMWGGGGGSSGIGSWLGGMFGGGAGGSLADMGGAGVLMEDTQAAGAAMGNSFAGSIGLTDWAGEAGVNLGESAGLSFASKAAPMFAGALAGWQIGEQIGGTAGGLIGAAGLATAAYFIPVVGWIAGAASLVNSLTHGGLFGTKYAPTGATETDIALGEDASISNQFQESKKKALFGGTSTKWVGSGATPEQQAALDQMEQSLLDGVNAFAAQFGEHVADLVGGTFKIATDKAGKQTFSDTVLGVTRTGETQQQFAERLQADNFLAVLDQMGLGASEFVSGMQGDADKLAAAVQDFAGTTQLANVNLANGFHFLALSSDQTLVEVMKFVEGSQQAGETLQQTYTRLAQAQQQYNQFVAQFAKPATYVDPLEESFSKIYNTMLANIDAANKLAQAAGAAGAAQSDLANIEATAQAQMAAALQDTVNSAQSLAFSLGITLIGSLDQVNQAISDIVNKAKSAPTTTAIEDAAQAADTTSTTLVIASRNLADFGGAVQSVSQKAKDAVSLLLGDLSPLNDQEKLQLAMEGLAQGTVTKDQVLQIGRALYASSEAYNTLFNQVMAMPDLAAKASGGGGGGGGHAVTKTTTTGSGADTGMPGDFSGSAAQWAATGLTPAQWAAMDSDSRAKLVSLLGQQQALQLAQQHQQFTALAQQIAEISTAENKSYTDVIAQMGIKPADLEKGLGLQTDEQLKAYMESQQSQLDSAKQNTASIVGAISVLPRAIADAFRESMPTKPVPTHAGLPSAIQPGETTTTPAGSSGGVISKDDIAAMATAIGNAVGRQIAPIIGQNSRNARTPLLA